MCEYLASSPNLFDIKLLSIHLSHNLSMLIYATY